MPRQTASDGAYRADATRRQRWADRGEAKNRTHLVTLVEMHGRESVRSHGRLAERPASERPVAAGGPKLRWLRATDYSAKTWPFVVAVRVLLGSIVTLASGPLDESDNSAQHVGVLIHFVVAVSEPKRTCAVSARLGLWLGENRLPSHG